MLEPRQVCEPLRLVVFTADQSTNFIPITIGVLLGGSWVLAAR